jgi:hypothetical protein
MPGRQEPQEPMRPLRQPPKVERRGKQLPKSREELSVIKGEE